MGSLGTVSFTCFGRITVVDVIIFVVKGSGVATAEAFVSALRTVESEAPTSLPALQRNARAYCARAFLTTARCRRDAGLERTVDERKEWRESFVVAEGISMPTRAREHPASEPGHLRSLP